MNKCSYVRQLLFTVLSIVLCSTTTLMYGSAAFQPLSEADYNALSPADRQAYEVRFKEHINSLSPTEQQAFFDQQIKELFDSLPADQQKEVLEEAARIEKMSPAEQQAYFQKVEQDLDAWMQTQQAQSPAPVATPAPAPTPAQEEPEEVETKKKPISAPQISAEEKAIKEAVALLGEIAQTIDDITTKMEAKSDLQVKMSSWGKKKKITAWDGGFEWKKLSEKISIFRSQLDKLKDRDTTTKKHKYLPHLLEDKALYNKLYNMSIDLAEQEPTIKNNQKDKKVRARSNKAIRAVVNTFVDSLYGKNNLIESLNALFTKFDPEAKKITAKEEKAKQRALDESRRPQQVSGVKVAGRSQERDSFGYRGYGDDYGSRGYDSMGYGTPGYAAGSYGPQAATKESNLTEGKGGEKGSGGAAAGGEKTAIKETELKKDERVNKILKRFDSKIDVLDEHLSEMTQLSNLPAYVKSGAVDINFAQRQIPDLMKTISITTSELVKLQENLKPLTAPVKAAYKKTININIDMVKKRIEQLTSDLGALKPEQAQTPDMKWAHFRVKPIEPAVRAASTAAAEESKKSKALEIESVTTFAELKEKADEFLKKVAEFNTAL